MKLKTSEVNGIALDWAVAKCEGLEVEIDSHPHDHNYKALFFKGDMPADFTFEWTWAGPIIERERISVEPCFDLKWVAIRTESPNSAFEEEGPTPLIAAMRCHVANKMGDEIEVPDELMEGEEA